MPRIASRLTEAKIRNARVSDRQFKLYDADGLYLLVKPNGSKLWRWRYHFALKEKVLALGVYPQTSLADARLKRDKHKCMLDRGHDPSAERKALKRIGGASFKEVATAWHENRKDSLDPAHEQRVWSRMERDVLPIIGPLDIDKITAPEILAMVRRVEDRGSLTIAKRLRAGCAQVFDFAIAEGFAVNNPANAIQKALKPSLRQRNMTRLPINLLPKFLRDLEGFHSERTRLAFRLLILTWARTSEIRFAEAAEFEGLDSDNPLWRIPGEKMKMEREHQVPLSRQAVVVAKRLIELAEGGAYLFPGRAGAQEVMSNTTMLQALYTMGYRGVATVHGFRGLASTWANEALKDGDRAYDSDWIETQLSHGESDEIRAAYNSAQYIGPRRRMLQDWADFIDAGCRAAESDDFDALR